MKRMEWGSENNKLKENWSHCVSFNVTGKKTAPPWPLMSVTTIKKIYMYDHAAACLACRKSPEKNFFQSYDLSGVFHTKSSTLLLMLNVNINNTDLA